MYIVVVVEVTFLASVETQIPIGLVDVRLALTEMSPAAFEHTLSITDRSVQAMVQR
jgi:hypothetical protein